MPASTLVSLEGFMGFRENFKVLTIIYWFTDDRKARGDLCSMNKISV
jgi:hypothetical protein